MRDLNRLQALMWCKKYVKKWPTAELYNISSNMMPAPTGWYWEDIGNGIPILKHKLGNYAVVTKSDFLEFEMEEDGLHRTQFIIRTFDESLKSAVNVDAETKITFVSKKIFKILVDSHPKFKGCVFGNYNYVVDGVTIAGVDDDILTFSEYLLTNEKKISKYFDKRNSTFRIHEFMDILADIKK